MSILPRTHGGGGEVERYPDDQIRRDGYLVKLKQSCFTFSGGGVAGCTSDVTTQIRANTELYRSIGHHIQLGNTIIY